jgi:hypothetical protein
VAIPLGLEHIAYVSVGRPQEIASVVDHLAAEGVGAILLLTRGTIEAPMLRGIDAQFDIQRATRGVAMATRRSAAGN